MMLDEVQVKFSLTYQTALGPVTLIPKITWSQVLHLGRRQLVVPGEILSGEGSAERTRRFLRFFFSFVGQDDWISSENSMSSVIGRKDLRIFSDASCYTFSSRIIFHNKGDS